VTSAVYESCWILIEKYVFVLCVCSFIYTPLICLSSVPYLGARVLQSLPTICSCFSSWQFSSPSALADPVTAERFFAFLFLFSLPQSPTILSTSCFCCSTGSQTRFLLRAGDRTVDLFLMPHGDQVLAPLGR
jgi:hypothetical protein